MTARIVFKGRPITKQIVADINTLFAVLNRNAPIPRGLAERLVEAGVEVHEQGEKLGTKDHA